MEHCEAHQNVPLRHLSSSACIQIRLWSCKKNKDLQAGVRKATAVRGRWEVSQKFQFL